MLSDVSRAVVLAAIRFYRTAISPLLPPACRYEPTCSEYARIAVERYGAARGTWLGLKRLARCHPFGGSGFDPVPGVPAAAGEGRKDGDPARGTGGAAGGSEHHGDGDGASPRDSSKND